MAKVYHSEIYGLRETKYNWLNKHSIKNVKWQKIYPRPEFYLFIPTDDKLANHYYSFPKITEIFPVNSVGIVTARDNFVIDFEKKELERRIKQFIDPKVDDEILKQTYGLSENQNWKIKEQREKLRKDLDWKDCITKILYRPFDERWILYHDEMVERTRKEVMKEMIEENQGICIGRQGSVIGSDLYDIVFITGRIVDLNLFRRGGELVFPLYIYVKSSAKKKAKFTQLFMFEPEEEYQAVLPNISKDIISLLCSNFRKPFYGPQHHIQKEKEKKQEANSKKIEKEGFGTKNIFYYIYAILYSNTYRAKYAEFLKIDFPRIPFTKDYKLFKKLGMLGEQLADLHLLKPASPAGGSEDLDKTISKFQGEGNNKVEKLKYETEKVWINKEQYFDGIKEEIWQYQIGGYQVCEKWLKDRKERTLTKDEILTYCKIVTALSKTIKLQNEIDKYYEKVEKTQ